MALPLPPTTQSYNGWEQQSAMSPNEPANSQFGNNPLNVAGGGAGVNMPPVGVNMPPVDENNFYGGQQIAGSTPSQADYQSVQQYSDQAYQQARRNLDPLQEQQNRRYDQEMINRGIDPRSHAGTSAADQIARQQADQNNSAMFGALQFGQGIQNQMSQQELANQQLAGEMRRGVWGRDVGMAGVAAQNLATNKGHQLGMGQLDLGRNQAEHGQAMDWLGYDMNVANMNTQNQLIQDALYNQAYGSVPIPQMGATNPYAPSGKMLDAGDSTWWSAGTEAGWGTG